MLGDLRDRQRSRVQQGGGLPHAPRRQVGKRRLPHHRPDVVAFNRAYLTEFEVALATSNTANGLIAAMKQKFPQAGLGRILEFTAALFFPS